MIICTSCAHPNPEGAIHCEACFTSLAIPNKTQCPNCSAEVLSSASFCGNCGYKLKAAKTVNMQISNEVSTPMSEHQAEEFLPATLAMPETADPNKTHLQPLRAALLHVQTDTTIELPTHLTLIHIGKPNNVIPPDVDVSGFPDSDIVSRVHADLRIENELFYLEDTGSSNGTYVNNLPLPVGNKHKLKAGDRIALGKGDKVSFIFQML